MKGSKMIYICNSEKLDKIKLNKNNYYIVSDFDQTITSGKSPGSWKINKKNSEELTKEENELYSKYRPIEIDNTIDHDKKFEIMYEWYLETLRLLIKYGVEEFEIEDTVNTDIFKLRDGAKDFFKKMDDQNIPVLILSAGIGNVIIQILKHNNLFLDNMHIYSNFVVFKDGKAKGILDEIIHTMTKNSKELLKKYGKLVENKDYIILFGDVLSDINMVSPEDLNRTITIGFLDNKIEENLEFFKNKFDIVCTNNTSFDEVSNVLLRYFK
jgi:5'-nucleotidase